MTITAAGRELHGPNRAPQAEPAATGPLETEAPLQSSSAPSPRPPAEIRRHAATPRLWAAQRMVLTLVAVDLLIALAVLAVVVYVWQAVSLGLAAFWAGAWFLSTLCLGGFRSGHNASARLASSLRVGIATLAVCAVTDLMLGLVEYRFELIAVVGALVVGGGVSRQVICRVSKPRIIAVSTAEQLPDGALGKFARHISVSPEALADPALLTGMIRDAARALDASYVEIVGDTGLPDDVVRGISWELRKQHVGLRFLVLTGSVRADRVRHIVHRDHTMLEIAAPNQPLVARAAKRLIDIAGSLLLIGVFSLLLLGIAVLVKATSPGPVLYSQERVGRDGKLFRVLKFRSMTDGADQQLQALLRQQHTEDKPLFKIDNDARITPAGAVLRRYSLDELPQLFNVLGGSMSLVGPRPQRPSEVALYDAEAMHRLGVVPGMTGLWQVSGRSRLSWEEAKQLDVDYAHNWSLRQDLRILIKTARAVVGADGAY